MTEEQYSKLDKNVYLKYSLTDRVEESCVDARNLLCCARFDFYAILVYIHQKVNGIKRMDYALRLYRERTNAMTGFRMSENGNDEKNSFNVFVDALDRMIYDFMEEHYDIDRTYIPVDKNNIPMDGAHRVSCAAYFGKKIKILKFLDKEYQFKGYKYLEHELLPTPIMDAMCLEAMNWHEDLYVFFLWPQAHTNSEKLQKAVGMIEDATDVMYQVEYKLSYHAIKNLMLQIYGHMDWIGTVDNCFANLHVKADEVWASNGKVNLMIVRAPSCEYMLELKTKIRDMYGIGLSSCHSTDNMRETHLALNALLNPNSRHFLEKAKPSSFPTSYKIFDRFRNMVDETSTPQFIVDSSMVLALYGAREARDLDYYCLPNTDTTKLNAQCDIEEHDDSQKVFYDLPVKEYIINPENYFVFNGVKFISLVNLLKFKRNRYVQSKDPKDAQDIAIINRLYSQEPVLRKWLTAKKYDYLRHQRLVYNWIYALIFWRRREILEKVGLYKPLKVIKNLLKG